MYHSVLMRSKNITLILYRLAKICEKVLFVLETFNLHKQRKKNFKDQTGEYNSGIVRKM